MQISAAERLAVATMGNLVTIAIDGNAVYLGSVDELRLLLERHAKFMSYIDSHDERGRETK